MEERVSIQTSTNIFFISLKKIKGEILSSGNKLAVFFFLQKAALKQFFVGQMRFCYTIFTALYSRCDSIQHQTENYYLFCSINCHSTSSVGRFVNYNEGYLVLTRCNIFKLLFVNYNARYLVLTRSNIFKTVQKMFVVANQHHNL